MDERTALRLFAADLLGAGDDAAVVDDPVITADTLHETTNFPAGMTRCAAGQRTVGVSLSDVAVIDASAICAITAYAAVEFDETELGDFARGARDICEAVDTPYVGGNPDTHREFATATTTIGRIDDPAHRSGAELGDLFCAMDELGRSVAVVHPFEVSETDRADDLFRFIPRVAAGIVLRGSAISVIDSSDGLARSTHQLAEADDYDSELGLGALSVYDAVEEAVAGADNRRGLAALFGKDFELVLTLPEPAFDAVRDVMDTPLTVVGEAVKESADATAVADGEVVPDCGYTHDGGE